VDLLDRLRLTSFFAKHQPNIVINLAANPIVSSADREPDACERDIVESTRNLVSAVNNAGSVQRMVQVSSSMVYGNFFGMLAAETRQASPINAYGRMKLAAEDLVRELGARGLIETVIVRPMAVYGPGDAYTRVIAVFCAQAVAGRPLTVRATADTSIDFSYVEDVVEGLMRTAFEPAAAGETFNLSYGQAHTLLDVIAALRLQVKDLRYEVIPVTDSRPSRGALDTTKARNILGFEASVSLEMGLGRCIEFLRRSPPSLPASTMPVANRLLLL
jgi:nucleoside-diphosphate-sugar epimerase